MVKAIAFDLDGTLINDTDILIEAEVKAFMSKGAIVTYSELRSHGGTSIKDLAKTFLKEVDDETIKDLRALRKEEVLKNLDKIEVFQDTLPTLKKLKEKGIKLGIATGLGRDLLPLFLKKTGIDTYMAASVSADDVRMGKPAPDVFLRAFELMGVKPQEGLVVGDSKSDIKAAEAAKAPSILIVRDGTPICKSDYTIKDLGELIEITTAIKLWPFQGS